MHIKIFPAHIISKAMKDEQLIKDNGRNVVNHKKYKVFIQIKKCTVICQFTVDNIWLASHKFHHNG